MVSSWSLIFLLITFVDSRVIRRSYGVNDGSTTEDEKQLSGYYYPDNAPDITKTDYDRQRSTGSSYDDSEQREVTLSTQSVSSDWRPETPSPPSSDEVLPMREVFTLIPQTPDTEYPDPEWAGEERTTKRPLTTTERPWETTTRTARPWWETTTTQRPWWETTDRPWWETTTTQKPSWESSTTPQSRWMTSTTQQPRWEYSTALPWWISSTRPSSLSNQREKSRRLPIPRRASLGCRMLNPLIDGKSHPDNDSSCILDEVIQSGCSCRYLRGENDERGCARYFLTLCTRR